MLKAFNTIKALSASTLFPCRAGVRWRSNCGPYVGKKQNKDSKQNKSEGNHCEQAVGIAVQPKPCEVSSRAPRRAKAKKQQVVKHKSIWEFAECCRKRSCTTHDIRFDEMYYKPIDMAKRECQQTWCEFPPLLQPQTPICSYDDDRQYPVSERRRFARKPKPVNECQDWTPAKIRERPREGCARLSNNDCPTPRVPGKCIIYRDGKSCKKICCPNKSFSELKPKTNKAPLTQHDCLKIPTMCEIYKEMLRQRALKTKN